MVIQEREGECTKVSFIRRGIVTKALQDTQIRSEHEMGKMKRVQGPSSLIESRREQSRLQEELSMKEKLLRDTQIRNMHEMGEMKRAKELRVDESSVQKLRENHQTIQQLTSQMQDMQEQMNSMNDSREFHEVESNYRGRLSHVSSQPEMISSSRSLPSRDKKVAA